MEAEITREWKEKCERVQAAAQNKLQRGHNEWLQERQVLESKMAEQERKVTASCCIISLLVFDSYVSFDFNYFVCNSS